MFMGKAQLVELGLKNILMDKYGCEEKSVERWPLGRLIKELCERGLRGDLLQLMEELKGHRNYIAHKMLGNNALMRRLVGSRAQRFAWKDLHRGLYLVEQAIVVHDFLFGD